MQSIMDKKTSLAKKEIKSLKAAKASCDIKLKKYFADKTVSLEERWDLFCESEAGEYQGYIQHFDFCKKDFGGKRNAFEEFFNQYRERHETVHFASALEDADEWIGQEITVVSGYEYDKTLETKVVTITQEHLDAFKEEILGKFMAGFTYDW